jgi:hypothetical protein
MRWVLETAAMAPRVVFSIQSSRCADTLLFAARLVRSRHSLREVKRATGVLRRCV